MSYKTTIKDEVLERSPDLKEMIQPLIDERKLVKTKDGYAWRFTDKDIKQEIKIAKHIYRSINYPLYRLLIRIYNKVRW